MESPASDKSELDKRRFLIVAFVAGVFLNALLLLLAQVVGELLEHRVAERTSELEKSTARMDLATEGSGIGIWEIDVGRAGRAAAEDDTDFVLVFSALSQELADIDHADNLAEARRPLAQSRLSKLAPPALLAVFILDYLLLQCCSYLGAKRGSGLALIVKLHHHCGARNAFNAVLPGFLINIKRAAT